jgi:hypothetical protein
MTKKEHINNYFEKAKETFKEQYGSRDLVQLSVELLNSKSFWEFKNSLNNKFFPTSEQITLVITKNDFINRNIVFIGKPTKSQIEKKLDYFQISFLIILEHWVNNLLPKQDNVMPKVSGIDDDKAKLLNNMAGWDTAEKLINRVNQMYDELEKEYNSI